MKLISNYEILLFLKDVAEKEGVKISSTESAFFVYLVGLFKKRGVFDDSECMYRIQLSIRDLVDGSKLSINVVRSSLDKFVALGLLKRIPAQPDVLHLVNTGALAPFTYMDLSPFIAGKR